MHVCLSQEVKVSPTMNSHVERKNVNITSPRGHPHPTSPRPQPNHDITSDTPDKGHPTRSLTSPPSGWSGHQKEGHQKEGKKISQQRGDPVGHDALDGTLLKKTEYREKDKEA